MRTRQMIAADLEALATRNKELSGKIEARTALTQDENTELLGMTARIKALENEMALAIAAEEAAARAAGSDHDRQNPQLRNQNRRKAEHETLADNYDIGRAMRNAAGKLRSGEDAGLEIEQSQEGERICRMSGIQTMDKPGIFVPDSVMRTGTTAPLDAGNLIPASQREVAEGIRAKLFMEDLGLVVETALPGQNNIPVADYIARGYWVGEADAARTAIAANVRKETLTAIMLEVPTLASWYFQAMAGNVGASVLNQTMLQAEAETVDATLITRGSSTVAPKGIMDMDAYVSQSSLGVVEFGGANGKSFTYDDLIDMVNSPDTTASGSTNPAWVTSPYMRAVLQKLKLDAGSGEFVWDRRDMNTLLSYKAAVTTLVGKIARGTTTMPNGAKPIIFGHFGNALVVLRWPVRQIIVDPYTDPNGTKTRSIAFYDWKAKNPQALCRGYATN